MPKKRKLNSKNPRYQQNNTDDAPKIKKRVRMPDAAVRTYGGKKTGAVCKVYAVFYEN
jgi:hypothetical protein